MKKSFSELFNAKDEYLEKVIILPVGNYTSGSYNLPAGIALEDLESIRVMEATNPSGANLISVAMDMASKPAYPFMLVGLESASNNATVTFTGSTTFTIARNGDNFIQSIIGYRRNYATKNISKIINVNNGNNISANQRYEIDIASTLGSDYVGKDLIVQAEVFNETGVGTAGWGDSGYYVREGNARFTKAAVLNDKIVVQTGNYAVLSSQSNHTGNPFGRNGSDVTSAKCRVKVWKVDQFVTSTSNAPSTYREMVLFSASVTAPYYDRTIPLLDDMTKFDAIRVYVRGDGNWVDSRTFDPDTLLANPSIPCFLHTYESTEFILAKDWTRTSFYCDAHGGGAPLGVFKVVGIKY